MGDGSINNEERGQSFEERGVNLSIDDEDLIDDDDPVSPQAPFGHGATKDGIDDSVHDNKPVAPQVNNRQASKESAVDASFGDEQPFAP